VEKSPSVAGRLLVPWWLGPLSGLEFWGKKMTDRRVARRYELNLPVVVRAAAERKAADSRNGQTRDISTRGVYFLIDQNLEPGSTLDFMLTLPAEITQGTEVFIHAQGKVVRVERKPGEEEERVGVAAVIEKYDIIRAEPASS
jgi:c-di-GMP-binding flagellar brake protein YcgR